MEISYIVCHYKLWCNTGVNREYYFLCENYDNHEKHCNCCDNEKHIIVRSNNITKIPRNNPCVTQYIKKRFNCIVFTHCT